MKFCLKPLHHAIFIKFHRLLCKRILIACFLRLLLLTSSPIIESCWSGACEAFKAFNQVWKEARLILSYSMQKLGSDGVKIEFNYNFVNCCSDNTLRIEKLLFVTDMYPGGANVKVSISPLQPQLQSKSFFCRHSLSLWFNLKTKFRFPSIPDTITLSAPLLIISFIILLISYLLFLLAICSQKYKIFYFVAGIGFIISGKLK